MLLPTIFKRTSAGKVQEWTIEVEGAQYRTIAGQQDGKKVTSKWTTCKGKNIGKANETTPEAQAQREAEAKRRLKLEGEYTEVLTDIDNGDKWKEPMLAKDYKEHLDKVVFPICAQPKLDGMRCIATRHGLFSRNGKPILSAPHIMEALAPVFEKNPDLELDGELYNHNLKDDFDTLISLVKQQKPTEEDLAQSALKIQYWVYDIRDAASGFWDRTSNLWVIVNDLSDPRVRFVPTVRIDSFGELNMYYKDWRDVGYEGQMIRILGEGYEFKRTVNLLKRKEFIDEEFKIHDIEEGKGNRSGMAGRMVFYTKEGNRFESNIKAGHDHCRELLVNKHLYIGKMATVRYQNLTPKGIPRFPEVVMIDRAGFEGIPKIEEPDPDEQVPTEDTGTASED